MYDYVDNKRTLVKALFFTETEKGYYRLKKGTLIIEKNRKKDGVSMQFLHQSGKISYSQTTEKVWGRFYSMDQPEPVNKKVEEPDFKLQLYTDMRVGSKANLRIFEYGKELDIGVSNKPTTITFGFDFNQGVTVEEKLFFGKDAYRKPISFYS